MMKKRLGLNNENAGYIYLLPSIVFILLFVGYPFFYNIIISFKEVNTFTLIQEKKAFIGWANFEKIFKNKVFWKSLVNTVVYTVGSVAIQFVFGFILAMIYNKFQSKMLKSMRALTMIPYVIPITVVAILFKFMFANNGVINEILLLLGIVENRVEWLLNGDTAMLALIITNGWRGIPYTMILITAALVNISDSVIESALIDGTNGLQRFLFIKVPIIKPSLIATLTLIFIQTFKNFDLVFTITGGGPVKATELMTTFAYRLTFSEGQYGQGAATTLVLFVILMVMGFFYLKFVKNDEVM